MLAETSLVDAESAESYNCRFLPSLRLNSCSLDSKTNWPKYTTLHLTLPTLLEILASSLTNIFTFSDQITSLSKACYYHIRQLRCTRPYLDSSTARSIATSIVHSNVDYCNSLYYKLPKSQLFRLQHIQNSLTRNRTVVKVPKSCHITPILRSLSLKEQSNCIPVCLSVTAWYCS